MKRNRKILNFRSITIYWGIHLLIVFMKNCYKNLEGKYGMVQPRRISEHKAVDKIDELRDCLFD